MNNIKARLKMIFNLLEADEMLEESEIIYSNISCELNRIRMLEKCRNFERLYDKSVDMFGSEEVVEDILASGRNFLTSVSIYVHNAEIN